MKPNDENDGENGKVDHLIEFIIYFVCNCESIFRIRFIMNAKGRKILCIAGSEC